MLRLKNTYITKLEGEVVNYNRQTIETSFYFVVDFSHLMNETNPVATLSSWS